MVARQVLRHWQGVTPPLLSSFSPVSLAAARDEARELPRALLVGDVPVDWREQIDRLDCFALHCHYRAATQAFLAHAAAHARPVLCYTVNRAALARKLQSLGVSALVTDRLDLIPPAAAL